MSEGKKWEGEEVKAFSDIKVQMASEVWDHLMGWCKAATSEVSGMMLVEYDPKEGTLNVNSIYLPKQECDSASTEIDDDALAELQMQVHKEGKNLKSMRGWWHTHYNFSVFWSGTDTGTIDKLMSGNDWFLSIVVNQSEEFKARLDIATPFPIVIDDMDIVVTGQTEDLSKYKKDIDAQVSRKTHVIQQHSHYQYPYGRWEQNEHGYGGWWNHGDTPNTPSRSKEHKPYEGKWWEKWDPTTWHSAKARETIASTADVKAQCRAVGQSEADFNAEVEADKQLEAAYAREAACMAGDDDPMLERLEYMSEQEAEAYLGLPKGSMKS
jgi:hypothetical protein